MIVCSSVEVEYRAIVLYGDSELLWLQKLMAELGFQFHLLPFRIVMVGQPFSMHLVLFLQST